MSSFLLLISILVVAVGASHESVPAQVYWNRALPATPMPAAIKDFLHPVDIHGHGTRMAYKVVEAADMLKPKKITLQFVRTTSGLGPTFLSRRAADSIPFSSSKLPEILTHFSLEPNSEKAESIKETLAECEAPNVEGETKHCATSLESMVEFVTTTLNTRKVQALSTVISKEGTPKQQYNIVPSGVKKLAGSNLVACHARRYPYAVLYCHKVQGLTAYQTSMVGEDGTIVNAVAVCHLPYARVFAKYSEGFKSGKDQVCHFLPQDHIVWMAN